MPGRRNPIKDEEGIFDITKLKQLMKEYWEPQLALLLQAHSNAALGRDRVAYEARKDIFDRIYGKPVETLRQDTSMQINITLSPVTTVDSLDKPVDIILLKPDDVKELPVVEHVNTKEQVIQKNEENYLELI